MYWKRGFDVDVQSFSAHHINAIINHEVYDAWCFTGFYGELETANRENSWSLLRALHQWFSLPWVCLGDFNEILFVEEKQGWLDRPERQMQGFRDALDDCRLKDVGFNDFPFSWCNHRLGDQNVWVQLDRGVASIDWILRFLATRIQHLKAFHLDHKSLLLVSDSELKRFYRKGRPFQFESMWLKDRTCEAVVQDSWGNQLGNASALSFNDKILTYLYKLKEWNKKMFGHVRNSLTKKLKDLKVVEENGSYRNNSERMYKLRGEIQSLKNREESMWKQRSRNAWLKEGDSNTRFFHCRATQRNRRNFIEGLEDETGLWEVDETRMGKVLEQYFNSIFTSSDPMGFEEILNGIQLAMIEEAASYLDRDFQVVEVQYALKQMAPLTALGPNGMSPIFYKSFWHIVGDDVTVVVLKALNTGVVHESLNTTFITLIPKIKHPKKSV